MNEAPFGRHRAKINPFQTPSAETLAYAERMQGQELGPGKLAVTEWLSMGLELPDMQAMRRYRLERVRAQLRQRDYAGIVLYDPLNVRYATDSSNMQVWCTHNAARYCYIATDGPVILFDFYSQGPLTAHLDLIDEVRAGVTWFYFSSGPRIVEKAGRWAAEIADLVRSHSGDNRRIAIDRCNREGLHALEAHGLEIFNGEEVMELARCIKSADEIKAMRCAIAACETAMSVMQEMMVPGITEQRLWSYLHAENIARGGEWIETRILASGPRTNPWFQECSSREIEAGDLVAFDTDLIGPYGYCADISRTWLCGDGTPRAEQRDLYARALEQIRYNQEIPKPGMSLREIAEKSKVPDPEFYANRYSSLFHGVGLCDEYPAIRHPLDWEKSGYDGILEENMVICVESYMGRAGGHEGVKLEDQLLITKNGAVSLSTYPFENI